MVLPIFLYGTDVLRAKAKPVKELDDSIVKLVYDMFETMHKANGIGLAANQVGDLRRVIVIDISDVHENAEGEEESPLHPTSPDLPRTLVLINPEPLEAEGSWAMEEGCLSIPDVRAEVERTEKVRLRFRDASFKETELTVDGLLARVILHELDHLDGVLFTDRIRKARKSLLLPKLKKIKQGEIETSYAVITANES